MTEPSRSDDQLRIAELEARLAASDGSGGIEAALRDARQLLAIQGEALEALQAALRARRPVGQGKEAAHRAASERKAAEHGLMLEGIIAGAPVAIAYLDRTLVYRRVNPAALQMWGLSADQVLGRSVFEVFGPDTEGQTGALVRRVVETGEPFEAKAFPFVFSCDDTPTTTYWDFSLTPIAVDGAVQGVLQVSLEVSGRVESERLQHAHIANLEATDRYKDEFLSVVSHELRTPLNFITSFASLLEDEVLGPLNERQREALGKILAGSDRMLGLVNDLLDVARLQSGKFHVESRPTAYAPLVEEALAQLQPLADGARLTLSAKLAAVPQAIAIDGVRIGQVLTNLVNNAIKFSNVGGAIAVNAFVREGALVTEVVDHGRGIAEADQSKLFQRFGQLDTSKTRPFGGSGLGLVICKAIVEAHGGAIGVRSQVGIGSTFWFSLPMDGAIDAGVAARLDTTRARPSRSGVLIPYSRIPAHPRLWHQAAGV